MWAFSWSELPHEEQLKGEAGSGQERWGRERHFAFLIISQKKEMLVKSEKQQYYIKYIQRGFVQEERREAPAELGKDQEDQRKSALPPPPRQPDSLTGPEEAEGSSWGPSDRNDHSETTEGRKGNSKRQ